MRKLYVIDTNSLIAFYHDVFKDAPCFQGSPELSMKTKRIIGQAIISLTTDIRLSIPCVVFIAIEKKSRWILIS